MGEEDGEVNSTKWKMGETLGETGQRGEGGDMALIMVAYGTQRGL